MKIPECVELEIFYEQSRADIETALDTGKCPHCGGPLCSPPPEPVEWQETIWLSCAQREMTADSLDNKCLLVRFVYYLPVTEDEMMTHDPAEWEKFGEYVFGQVIAAFEPDEALKAAREAE